MIEQDDSNSLIIAATNHPEMLDHAVFRRFDDVVEYALPGPNASDRNLEGPDSEHFADARIDWDSIATTVSTLSYADLHSRRGRSHQGR